MNQHAMPPSSARRSPARLLGAAAAVFLAACTPQGADGPAEEPPLQGATIGGPFTLIDAEGETHERVFDIAVSGNRVIGEDGRARAPVGNTVDIETATYTNSIGAPALDGIWEDSTFDPSQNAFYYVRVIEIPKPRWTTHDAVFFDIPLPDSVPPTTQDRAYTSPIWYSAAD